MFKDIALQGDRLVVWKIQTYSTIHIDEGQALRFRWEAFHSLHEVGFYSIFDSYAHGNGKLIPIQVYARILRVYSCLDLGPETGRLQHV